MSMNTINLAQAVRISSLKMVSRAKASHIGSALSIVDILSVLYGKILNYDKENEIIKSIPNLLYNKQSKRFTLKRSEKRVSTLKSLGPSRKRNSANKTKKITIESEN